MELSSIVDQYYNDFKAKYADTALTLNGSWIAPVLAKESLH